MRAARDRKGRKLGSKRGKKTTRKGLAKKYQKKKSNMKIKRKNTKVSNRNVASKQIQASGCAAFFTPSNIKDYKYARNLIQKAKRIKSSYSQLDKKHEKATTVFANATAFFKKCPPGSDIYDKLRY